MSCNTALYVDVSWPVFHDPVILFTKEPFVNAVTNCQDAVVEFLRATPTLLVDAISVTDYKWAATWQNQQSDCAPSEDSDRSGHPPSLIRVFAVRLMGS